MYLQIEPVPCIVKISEGEGITGHILTNVLRKLDDLKLYENNRGNGIIPGLLVDGHASHFGMVFFKYICDENNKWTVVFGICNGRVCPCT